MHARREKAIDLRISTIEMIDYHNIEIKRNMLAAAAGKFVMRTSMGMIKRIVKL